MKLSRAGWYLRRLEKMSLSELVWRASDATRKVTWTRHRVAPGGTEQSWEDLPGGADRPVLRPGERRFGSTLDQAAVTAVPDHVRSVVIAAADEIMAGRYELLGVVRKDMEDPDWFFDPVTGRRAPQVDYCFRVDSRSEDVTGNVKQVWELSRMHHLTVLATAFALSGDERYARRVARHLRSWWRENPFLSGVHWTSGIEIGLRLIAWVWVRRLLEGWAGARDLFEDNDTAVTQIWWHQRYLDAFRSRGSSANNHVIAEAAGQLVASLAFDWFEESPRWASEAASLLEAELRRNTFPSGVNREMAFDYHGFVAELGLVAAVEADRAGRPLDEGTWELLARMLDVVAATVDVRLRAPRQGDGDDGRALVLEPSPATRWADLLALGSDIFGAPGWWPTCPQGATSRIVASLASRHPRRFADARRPSHFADAGLTIMRSAPAHGPEIWCRCDAGPHGFLSIAAHAHADALAVEVRHGGVEVLADPGTYCYQGQAEWRRYFRSTLGHNTVEIAGQDQSKSGGPTLWIRHADSRLVDLGTGEDGEVTRWVAEHDGYTSLRPPATHRRAVDLSSAERRLTILDQVETQGCHPVRLAFHLGPDVDARLHGRFVELRWSVGDTGSERATLHLPEGPTWSVVRGSSNPVLGWYSKGFGQKQPTTTIVGELSCHGGLELRTVLNFGS